MIIKKNIKLGILLTGVIGLLHAANVALVLQTGQTAILPLNPAPAGSDGALQKGAIWPTPRFVLDTSGNCITDKLTGLVWIKDPSLINSSTVQWQTALDTANSGTWCGYDDWRIPNMNELMSLMNYGRIDPTVWLMYGSGTSSEPNCDGACFSNVDVPGKYWSSTTVAGNNSNAFYVWMSGYYIGGGGKSFSPAGIWPVRGGH